MKPKIPTAVSAMRSALFGMLAAVLCFAGGCASMFAPPPPPVTVSEIISMSKSGVTSQEIIKQIRASGTIYRLKASELAALKSQGVSDDVIDYMQSTYLDAMRRDAFYRANYYGPGCWGYYPNYYGPYPPVIVIEQPRGHH